MSTSKSALILYPNQLYALEHLPKVGTVILVEEPLYFGFDQEYPLRLHKQKLILHRASMRRYTEEVLWPAGYEVDYVELDVFMSTGDVLDRTKKFGHVYIFEPTDEILAKRLLKVRRERDDLPTLEFLPTPNFYLKDNDVRQYFNERHQHLFADFYQWQRERFNILIGDDYKPLGGKWSLKSEKAQKLPEGQDPPGFTVFGSNKHVADAVVYINEHFPDNPGSTDFIWPTNHTEAKEWLNDFIENRLPHYGTYEAAIGSKAPWLYHSALAGSLNVGLLSPQEVVEAALKRHERAPINIEDLESFICKVLGWREFTRGLYLVKEAQLRASNTTHNQRRLTNAWYEGTTGLPPFDDMVKKLWTHAYVHNTERSIIAGNLMMLCEIHPEDMYRWHSELFIDAYDWVLTPEIYALTNFAGDMPWVAQSRLSSSHTLLQVSNYERGQWADTWDGLFWRFVEKHKTLLNKQPHMRVMVQRLGRLDPDRKRIIGYRAEDFLNNFTR
ncbi:cryptochrome/photolyase family protein [soil metagenome]